MLLWGVWGVLITPDFVDKLKILSGELARLLVFKDTWAY